MSYFSLILLLPLLELLTHARPEGLEDLDVLSIDGGERRREDTVLLRHLVLPGEHAAVEATYQRRQHHGQQRHREKSGITHNRMVTDQVLQPQRLPGEIHNPFA